MDVRIVNVKIYKISEDKRMGIAAVMLKEDQDASVHAKRRRFVLVLEE